jgi:flagellar secretion chaperone FliS
MAISRRAAAKQYKQMGVQTGVEQANPHRLVQMLMQGGLDKIARAKGALQRDMMPEMGNNITGVISIIDALRASLDIQTGGDLAANLHDLYNYMIKRLLRANLDNDAEILDEVAELLRDIKSGWDAIPEHLRTNDRAVWYKSVAAQ